MVVAVQLSAAGLYLPPVLQSLNVSSTPPQTIISLPLHTAVLPIRPGATLTRASRHPTVCSRGCICRRCVNSSSNTSTPDNHLAAGPHRSVSPIVRKAHSSVLVVVQLSVPGLYRPPAIQVAVKATSVSAPDDHLAARPDRRVLSSCGGRISSAGRCPTVRYRIVSAACVQNVAVPSLKPPQIISSLPVHTAL